MIWATPVSGTGITGGGSGYAALLAHAEGVLYGMELGSVTLKINTQHIHEHVFYFFLQSLPLPVTDQADDDF